MTTKELNEFLKEITTATKQGKSKKFKFECDNCILSIKTCTHIDSIELKAVEIVFLNKQGLIFKMPSGYSENGNNYCIESSIIDYVPIIGIPLVLKAFYHAEEDDIAEIFNSFSFMFNYCF